MTPNIREDLLKQFSPSAGFWQKFKRKCQMYITLNTNDLQCRHFFFNSSQKKIELRRHANGPHNKIIHPFSKLNRFFLRVLFLLLMHKVILLPYPKAPNPLLWTSALVRDITISLLAVCSFFTGYADWRKEEVILEPKTVVKHYLSTYFLVDVLTVSHEYIYFTRNHLLTVFFDFLGISATVVKVSSVHHVITETLMYLNVGPTICFIIENLVILAFIVQIMACVIYWLPVHIYRLYQEYPQNSWIIIDGFTFYEYNTNIHIRSYLLASSYFLGSSYFHLVNQPVEQLLLFLFTFTGRLYTMVIIARVLNFFGFSETSECDYENLMYQINNYMRSMNVPKKVQNMIRERIEFSYQKKYFNEQDILSIFTERIQAELFLHGARNLIKKNTLLSKFNAHQLAKLFSHMKTHIYVRDEIIQDYGGGNTHIYFISSGSCAGLTAAGIQFTHVGDGDCFGCIRLDPSVEILYQSRYVALETTETYNIHFKMMKWCLEHRPDLLHYFTDLRMSRSKGYKDCKTDSTRSKTFLEQLNRGKILEQPKLRIGDHE